MVNVLSDPLEQLDLEVERLILNGSRPGTKKNLKSQVSTYYRFCELYHLRYLPADEKQITRFAAYLSTYKNLKPDTINNYLSGVRTLHCIAEMPVPKTDGWLTKAVLKGIKSDHIHPKKQAEAITPHTLKLISMHVQLSDNVQMVAWVATLIGFHCLLRASNLTCRSVKSFNKSENLLRQDFRMHKHVLLAHIKWTKTLQYRERKLLIPVIPFDDEDINAVSWFTNMIDRIPAPPDAPAFAIPTKHGIRPLTYDQLRRCLRKWTQAADLNSEKYTCHCLRRGGASWLDEQGVPESVIAVIGDWRTNCFKQYIDSALKTRMKAMVMFANANNKTFS